MTDREKVIKGLECRKNVEMRCGNPCEEIGNCKYATLIHDPSGEPYYPYICDRKKLCEDALALLKEQKAHSVCTKENCPMNANTISDDCNVKTCPWRTEALTPKVSMSGLWYECPVCGRHLTKDIDHYCARCGQAVKWDDTSKAD